MIYPEKTVIINKTKTTYIDTDSTFSKQTILLLHGILGSYKMFIPLIPFLTKHFRVIVPDLPGFGKTEPLHPNTIPGYSIWLMDFIKELQIHKPILFGVSMGGILALDFASKYQVIPSQVIVQGAPLCSDSIQPKQRELLKKILLLFQKKPIQKFTTFAQSNTLLTNIAIELFKLLRLEADLPIQMFEDKLGKVTVESFVKNIDIGAFPDMIYYLNNFDIREEIRKINNTLLAIIGSDDKSVNPNSLTEIKKLNKDAKTILHENMAHHVVIEHPDLISKDILSFYHQHNIFYTVGKNFSSFLNKIKFILKI
jgi:pimeloyl-ACP methyl ester carboxylesterase